ncbi:putative C2H2-type domain-containing protein [Seiridium cardinale]|uniref:C2H2-type domain-containing protein n=1 Tax=Seiridium cardinale TaxID=138064 RepID=A0ABR2Y301_9PEZI
MDDFNSSDMEELDHAPPDKWADRGKRSIVSMLESALDIRKDTKIAVRQATFHGKCPSEAERQGLWHNRFTQFRQHVLGVDSTSVPTAEQLERFMRGIPAHLQSKNPRSPGNPIQVKTLKAGLHALVCQLVFRFKDFDLAKHDIMRFRSALNEMVDNGILTRDVTRERMWITSDLVQQMASAMLQSSLDGGTLWWDYDIQIVAGLVLQSAMVSRAGDFLRSTRWKGREFLAWKDVKIRLDMLEDDTEKFSMTIALQYSKGQKANPDANRIIEFSDLRDPALNPVDPVLLLMVLALRTGAVEETNWAQLLVNMRSRASKRIVWAYPHRPIFCARHTAGIGRFDLDKPATNGLCQRAIVKGAKLCGLLYHPRSHDLRRGGAMEVRNARGADLTTHDNLARQSLGHTEVTAKYGLTERYTGHNLVDTWALRVRQPNVPVTPNALTKDRALTPYANPKRASAEAITAECEENGLDPAERTSRCKASKQLLQRHVDEWRAEQLASIDAIVLPQGPTAPKTFARLADPAAPKISARLADTAAPKTSARLADPAALQHPSYGLEDDFGLEMLDPALRPFNGPADPAAPKTFARLADPAAPKTSARLADPAAPKTSARLADPAALQHPSYGLEDEMTDADVELALTDPVLKSISDMLEDTTALPDDTLADRLILAPPFEEKGTSIKALDRDAFMELLSTINIRKFSHPAVYLPKCAEEDVPLFSRDPPTAYLSSCPNAKFGCYFTTEWCNHMDVHLKSCFFTTPEAAQEYFDSHPCVCDTCGLRYRDKWVLLRHLESCTWVPRRCGVEGCTSTDLFSTKSKYDRHQEGTHSSRGGLTCPLPNCPRGDHVWVAWQDLRQHLRGLKHGLSEEQVQQYKPAEIATRAPIKPQKCSFPGCNKPGLRNSRGEYNRHLTDVHKVPKEELSWYIKTDEELELRPDLVDVPDRIRGAIPPQQCSHDDCLSTTVFTKAGPYNTHLRVCHDVDSLLLPTFIRGPGEDLMPRDASFQPQVCSAPAIKACNRDRVWEDRSKYRSHLIRAHKLTSEESDVYLPRLHRNPPARGR